MTATTAAGFEVSEHKDLLIPVIQRIMVAHTARNGCGWKAGAIKAILCDLSEAVERQEICKAKEAA